MGRAASDQNLSWDISDLIDFELLAAEDEKTPEAEHGRLRQRDREIYRELATRHSRTEWERTALFRGWLEARRKERFAGCSPGEEIHSLLKWAGVALFIAGVLAARAAVWSFFRAAQVEAIRPEPINVFYYTLVCIAVPFALALYGFWVLLGDLPATARLPEAPPFLRGTLLNLLRSPLRRAAARLSEEMGPERRLNSQALFGALRRRIHGRKGVLAAYFFQVFQTFGLAFSLGVLLFSWIDCKFHSRVFAWQTTQAGTTAESVHAVVRAIAQPWAWLSRPGQAYPTLEQVRETRYIRFRDPAPFPMEAASAWASFVIMAALVYGALPRLLLCALSRRRVKILLKKENFAELRFDPLWHRMTRPAVDWGSTDHGPELAPPPGQEPSTSHSPAEIQSCLLLLPLERSQENCADTIRQWLAQERHWQVHETRVIDPEKTDSHGLSLLNGVDWNSSGHGVVLVQESFMPPVSEMAGFLRQIRNTIGPGGAILVGLLGKPGGGALGQRPPAAEVDLWRKKLLALGDPNLEVIPLQEAVP